MKRLLLKSITLFTQHLNILNMNSLKNFALVLFLSSFLLASCKKEVSVVGTAAYLPATSTSVTGFDLQRLMKKADFEAIKDMEFFKEISAKAGNKSPIIAAALNEPSKSGIDLNGKIFMSTDLDKNDPENITTHIFVPLSNVDDFEKLAKAADINFESKNGLRFFSTQSKGDVVMVWDDQLLTLTISNNQENDVTSKAFKLFEMAGEETLASNNNFAKAINQDHDMVTWLSTNTLADNPAAGMAMNMIDVGKGALKDNFIHGYGDFENGKIVGHSDFYLNKDLGRGFLGRFFKDGADTDFSKVLPSGDLAFALTGALNFRGMDQFLSERPQTKEYADFVLNDFAGFERKQILETLNGDVMIAGYSANDIKDDDFIVALALKDNGKANTMLKKAVAEKTLKEVEPGLYEVLQIGGEGFSIRRNKGMGKFLHFEDMLVYSPKEELLQKINKGEIQLGGEKVKETLKHFDNQTMAGWLDFQSIQKQMDGLPSEFFKDMRFNVNADGADFILETTNPNKNSLNAIFEMMEQTYLKKNREAM